MPNRPIRYLSPEEALQFVMTRSLRPDPLVDKRDLVEDTNTSRRLMRINRGKRITSPSQSALWRGGRYWPGWERTEPVLPVPGVISRRLLARKWARRERPDKVRPMDWELLRLTEVEGLKVPEIARRPEYKRLTVAALQKRLTRVRQAERAKGVK